MKDTPTTALPSTDGTLVKWAYCREVQKHIEEAMRGLLLTRIGHLIDDAISNTTPDGTSTTPLNDESDVRAAKIIAAFYPEATVTRGPIRTFLHFSNMSRWEGWASSSEERTRTIDHLQSIPYRDYLATEHWADRRATAVEIDLRCRLCNSRDNLQVHHRSYANRGEEGMRDLTVLCADCHQMFHKNKELVS